MKPDAERTPRRGPKLIEDGLDALPQAPASPADAPDVDAPPPAAATALRAASGRGGFGLGALFVSAFAGLLSLAVGLWFWETVEAMVARNLWLGRIALALAATAAAALFLIALRELAALSRLRRVDELKDAASRARATRDLGAARAAADRLSQLYKGRPALAAARADLTAKGADLVDGDALIDLAERELMTPLDAKAEAEVRRGARDVAGATALIPLPVIDVLAILAINLRMIRRIAEVYGGRAGWLGSWRLLRAIAAHLATAGAIAVGDDLIGPALGGGALAKVSRRFGEGLVNGALTARIGIAAMDVCRPMPFAARARPGVAALIKGALQKSGDAS